MFWDGFFWGVVTGLGIAILIFAALLFICCTVLNSPASRNEEVREDLRELDKHA
jgi:hypothetical protein